ncbi:hypothetical protein [Streptomyces sp. NPDC018045]|uniref:hypothetical protein n=1 Tax=Streptomyces sp. NPDC018045 TaxID=3365037 RepID=UPI00378F815F
MDQRVERPGLPLADLVATVMEGYADRPALGERATEPATDPDTGRTTLRLLARFDTLTYGELWDRVGAETSEWRHHPVPGRACGRSATGPAAVENVAVEQRRGGDDNRGLTALPPPVAPRARGRG